MAAERDDDQEGMPQGDLARESFLRLCNRCAAKRRIRRLYEKTASWTPERDARIQALADRAKLGLPLFPERKGPRPCAAAARLALNDMMMFPTPSARKHSA